jgi:hypothetical protein
LTRALLLGRDLQLAAVAHQIRDAIRECERADLGAAALTFALARLEPLRELREHRGHRVDRLGE